MIKQPINAEQCERNFQFRRAYSPIFAEILRELISSRSDGQRASSAREVIAQARRQALARMQQTHPDLMPPESTLCTHLND